MKFTVIGVIDGRRLEMPVQASNVVDAIRAAEEAGMVVVDVRSVCDVTAFGDTTRRYADATVPEFADAKKPPARKGDSPLLCFGLGFLIPVLGVLVGLMKWRDDQPAAGAAIVGAIIGFLIWGSIVSGL